MFAWDIEGRIGIVAGFWGVRDQTTCPGDFPPPLLFEAEPGPHFSSAAGRDISELNADRVSEL